MLAIRNLRLQNGNMFDYQDDRASLRVAVVGQTVVRDLFGGANPVGQTIRIGKGAVSGDRDVGGSRR